MFSSSETTENFFSEPTHVVAYADSEEKVFFVSEAGWLSSSDKRSSCARLRTSVVVVVVVDECVLVLCALAA